MIARAFGPGRSVAMCGALSGAGAREAVASMVVM
jgi:hypothetical protein